MEIVFKNDDRVLMENRDLMREGGTFSDCPIGWGLLVRQLFHDIRDACKKHKCPPPKIAQVKSKFGCLCFYLEHDNQRNEDSPATIDVNRLISDAEERSMATCEITGLPGSYYVKDGWYATLHKDKAIALGYKKVKRKTPREMKKLKKIHPGEVLLKDFLGPLKISPSKLAEATRMSKTRILEILKGERSITKGTALILSKYFGNSVEFWLGLQVDYDSENKKKL